MAKFDGFVRADRPAIIGGIVAALLIFFDALVFNFWAWPFSGLSPDAVSLLKQYHNAGRDLLPPYPPDMLVTFGPNFAWKLVESTVTGSLGDMISYLHDNGCLAAVVQYVGNSAAVAVVGGFVVAMLVYPHCGWRLKYGERQEAGRRLALPPDGIAASNEDLASEVRRTGTDLLLAPRVKLPWEHEVKGLMLTGAPGSGKTEIIKYLLTQLIQRRPKRGGKTRLIVLDACKGDYTSQWPSEDFILLAPHDDRCQPGPTMIPQAWAWDIARDCSSFQDAAEFAGRVIQESKEPQWAEGARLILQGALVGLQNTKGVNWGWEDLHGVVTLRDKALNAWMQQHFEPAVRYTALDEQGNASRNASSYINNYCATAVKFTLPLSLAWGDVPRNRRLSLRRWLLAADPDKTAQTIILGRSGQFSAMSAAWIGALLRLINSVVQSPALTESKVRRVLLVLDELRTIAAPGDCVKELIEIGRSKGIGTVIGIQSYDQLRDPAAWGDAVVDAFEGIVQTKIFGKMMTISSGRGGANAVAENVVGQGRFRRPEKSRTIGGGRGATTNLSSPETTRLVVEPTFFERLVPTLDGPQAAYLGMSSLCVLEWPWSGWETQRAGVVPARWIERLPEKTLRGIGYAEDPFKLDVEPQHRPWWRRVAQQS